MRSVEDGDECCGRWQAAAEEGEHAETGPSHVRERCHVPRGNSDLGAPAGALHAKQGEHWRSTSALLSTTTTIAPQGLPVSLYSTFSRLRVSYVLNLLTYSDTCSILVLVVLSASAAH